MVLRPYKMRFANLNRLRKILVIVVESGGGRFIDRSGIYFRFDIELRISSEGRSIEEHPRRIPRASEGHRPPKGRRSLLWRWMSSHNYTARYGRRPWRATLPSTSVSAPISY